MKPNRKLPAARGKNLDLRLNEVLEDMVREGLAASPISRSSVQQRLGLRSRSTFVGARAALIGNARLQQLSDPGISTKSRSKRAPWMERVQALQKEVAALKGAWDQYVMSLMEIVQYLQRHAHDVGKVLSRPLLSEPRLAVHELHSANEQDGRHQ